MKWDQCPRMKIVSKRRLPAHDCIAVWRRLHVESSISPTYRMDIAKKNDECQQTHRVQAVDRIHMCRYRNEWGDQGSDTTNIQRCDDVIGARMTLQRGWWSRNVACTPTTAIGWEPWYGTRYGGATDGPKGWKRRSLFQRNYSIHVHH